MKKNSNSKFYFLFTLFLFLGYIIFTHILEAKASALFSPDDKPTKHLIATINNAKMRIYAATYMLTDKKIAQSLIDAKKRNVQVQVVADKASLDSEFGKIKLLKQHGIDVFIYDPAVGNKNKPIMHNKFAIIDNKVWTGSFNWTISANQKNQENVVLIENEPQVCEKYLAQFEKLKQRCVYQKATGNNDVESPSMTRNLKIKIAKLLHKVRESFTY